VACPGRRPSPVTARVGEGSGIGGGEGGGATAARGAAGQHRWGGRRGWRRGTGGSGYELNGERKEEGGAARPICALGPCLPSAGPMGHSATFFFFLFFLLQTFRTYSF